MVMAGNVILDMLMFAVCFFASTRTVFVLLLFVLMTILGMFSNRFGLKTTFVVGTTG